MATLDLRPFEEAVKLARGPSLLASSMVDFARARPGVLQPWLLPVDPLSVDIVFAYTLIAVLAAIVALDHRRTRRAAAEHRRQTEERLDALAAELHQRALAFDQRSDELGAQLHRLELNWRTLQLGQLVAAAERAGKLPAKQAQQLERFALDLAAEAEIDGDR